MLRSATTAASLKLYEAERWRVEKHFCASLTRTLPPSLPRTAPAARLAAWRRSGSSTTGSSRSSKSSRSRLVTRLAPQHLLEVCPLTLSLAGGVLAGALLARHPLYLVTPAARALKGFARASARATRRPPRRRRTSRRGRVPARACMQSIESILTFHFDASPAHRSN